MVISRGELAAAHACRQAILLYSGAALRLLVATVGNQNLGEHIGVIPFIVGTTAGGYAALCRSLAGNVGRKAGCLVLDPAWRTLVEEGGQTFAGFFGDTDGGNAVRGIGQQFVPHWRAIAQAAQQLLGGGQRVRPALA